MGCFNSKSKESSAKPGLSGGGKASAKQTEEIPDPGLYSTHRAVKSLGKGGTGETWLYQDRVTGQEVAVKLMRRPLPKVIEPNIQREIRIQADLGEGHVNIVNAKEVLLTEFHLALVLEYASRGTLTAYVAEHWHHGQQHGLYLTEDEARYLFRQFINAVEFCHNHFVAHRDLKLDNTLLTGQDLPVVKLCDFGFAKDWGDAGSNMSTHIGTPVYMPPEMLNSKGKSYDGKSVDIWASGVLLIVMLLGQFPFDHIENPDPNSDMAHLEVWVQQVSKTWKDMPHLKHGISKLSPEVLDLLDNIFVITAEKRITLEQIKEHPWFTKPMPAKYEAAEKAIRERQVVLDSHLKDREISPDLLTARNQSLYELVAMACTRANMGDRPATAPLMRVNLAEEAITTPKGNMATISDAPEEEAALAAERSMRGSS